MRELHQRLGAAGFAPWIDENDILPGQDWQEEIPAAIRKSDVVIVFLSRKSVDKEGYLQREIRDALSIAEEKPEGAIFIIPVKIEEVDVPKRLNKWQWANLFSKDGYELLIAALNHRARTLGIVHPIDTAAAVPGRSGPSHTSSTRWTFFRKPFGSARKIAILLIMLMLLVGAPIALHQIWPPSTNKVLKIVSMTRLTTSGNVTKAAISPDGSYVAYSTEDGATEALHIHQLNTSTDTQIVPPEVGRYTGITFSRDGHFIYYVFQKNQQGGLIGTLFRIPILGGGSKQFLNDVDSPIAFSTDGNRYVFLRNDQSKHQFAMLLRSMGSNEEKILAVVDAPQTLAAGPIWSSDNAFIICGIYTGFTPGAANIKILSVRLADGRKQLIGPLTWYWMGKPIWGRAVRHVILAASDIRANRAQLVEVSLDNGMVLPVIHDTQSYGDLDSSSDYKRIAAIQSDRISTIWVASVHNLGRPRRITQQGARFYGIAWTKSGKLLSQSDIGGQPDLWSIDAVTGEMRQITDDQYVEELPVSSADGRYVVYGSNRDGAFHIWRSNVDGTSPTRLTSDDAHEESADITHDGRWVFYTSTKSGYLSIWQVPIDGGIPTQFSVQESRDPVVSPDGDLIACKYYDSSEGWLTVILRTKTRERVRSFKNIVGSPVRWSPDGKNLFYVKTQDGISNIWAQPKDGSAPYQITSFPEGHIFSFAVSPDGESIACVRGARTSDVVLLEAAE